MFNRSLHFEHLWEYEERSVQSQLLHWTLPARAAAGAARPARASRGVIHSPGPYRSVGFRRTHDTTTLPSATAARLSRGCNSGRISKGQAALLYATVFLLALIVSSWVGGGTAWPWPTSWSRRCCSCSATARRSVPLRFYRRRRLGGRSNARRLAPRSESGDLQMAESGMRCIGVMCSWGSRRLST